jgi:hypothetical protein
MNKKTLIERLRDKKVAALQKSRPRNMSCSGCLFGAPRVFHLEQESKYWLACLNCGKEGVHFDSAQDALKDWAENAVRFYKELRLKNNFEAAVKSVYRGVNFHA